MSAAPKVSDLVPWLEKFKLQAYAEMLAQRSASEVGNTPAAELQRAFGFKPIHRTKFNSMHAAIREALNIVDTADDDDASDDGGERENPVG